MLNLLARCAAPPAYRHPGCLGNTNNGRLGCVPRADAIPAWKDFAIFLASRWQGGSGGRIAHFIVWNEVQLALIASWA